ncbi:MAG TPA: helix-turn-helix transcriptional regulator [Opitutaceae bacterium]|jgi:transcriptional regulator with XRE-family HTH domain|nr:helix-turn-helix transcriptional regulator [Opitutaceae bacterium]
MVKEAKSELKSLGDSIRAQRKKLGISQEDFAELCDLHRTYIGQVERGEKNISFSNVLRVAKAFKSKPSALLAKAGL